jgi:hypothetical protein
VTVLGPTGSQVESAFLDTLVDDTVFPEDVATAFGLDAFGHFSDPAFAAAGGSPKTYASVHVSLFRLSLRPD